MPLVLPPSPTFATAKGWRIFLYVLLPPMAAIFLAMPLLAQNAKEPSLGLTAFMAVLGIGMGGFFIYGLLETVRWRLILGPEQLSQVGAFKTKTLAWDEVKGYRITQQYTFVVPKDKRKSTLKIGYTTERYVELQSWLARHFPNADVLEQEAAEKEALADHALGNSTEERSEQLARAAGTAKLLNIAGGLSAAWLIFFPRPYEWAVICALAVPLLAAAALWRHQGALRLNETTNSPYPSVLLAVLLPSLALSIRGLFDFEIVAYQQLWPVVGRAAVSMALLLGLGTREWLFRRQTAFAASLTLVFMAALYGYGASTCINAAFDGQRGRVFHTQVLAKHSSSGKTTTYYLTVQPWGPFPEVADIQVAQEQYQLMRPGSVVDIRLRPGRLGVPWYAVE
ncbi:hypothetical protein GCM10023185_03850 [Hymenobacter saemangeumensis]|uniref:DUF3592 domain-containing protein n=1 Tax=Hymenobacter saemangeumensis TaxID=1084522 RepID=A0ABP8HZR0_9BACT